jgi:hypothetical protein
MEGMSGMDKKDIIIKILKELYDNSKLLRLQELNIDDELYSDILEIMARSELIMNYNKARRPDGNLMYGSDIRITINGIEYLENKTRKKCNEELKLITKYYSI